MRYVCVTVLIQFIKEMTAWTFMQKSMESIITNCKFLQSNIITSYILLLRNITRYIT